MGRDNLIVYGTEFSPPCQAVFLTLKALGINNFELRQIVPKKADHYTPAYFKVNPAQSIPTLEDDGKFIGDSNAIVAYLASKYRGKNNHLYPNDLYLKAKVDEVLHFNNGTLQVGCMTAALRPIFAGKADSVPDAIYEKIEKAYKSLEGFFGENSYLAGQKMTVADLSCFPTLTALYQLVPITEEKYPKLLAWLQLMKSLPYFEEVMYNDKSMAVSKFVDKKLSKL